MKNPELNSPGEPDRDPGEQWEYASLLLLGDVLDACNRAGKKGWEVIQIEQQPDGQITALAKRKPQRIHLVTEPPSRLTSIK